jgi:hypothetical protein
MARTIITSMIVKPSAFLDFSKFFILANAPFAFELMVIS